MYVVQVNLKKKKIEASCSGDISCNWFVTAYHVRLSSDTHATRFRFRLLVKLFGIRQIRLFV
jgi:hypothetical protein